MPREITYNWLDRPAELTAQEALFVSRLKANEDAAYDELVRMYSSPIYHVAYRMTGDAAEASDAVQDIFLKVFRNIGGFKGEAALKTWIFKVAFSEILNRLRWWKRRYRFATVSLDEQNGNGRGHEYSLASSSPTPEQALQSKEQEAAIQQALGKLSREHRSIIVLRDIEGFSYIEIADVLGVSIGTVKSRLARARGDLKKSLMRYLSVQKV